MYIRSVFLEISNYRERQTLYKHRDAIERMPVNIITGVA